MQVLKGILKDSLEYYGRLQRELKQRIGKLPKGSIKKRRIKGHIYYYLQVRNEDKVVHRYLGRQEPKELMESIRKRRILVKELAKVHQALQLLPKRKLSA